MASSRANSRAVVEEILVSKIVVGERRRKKMGAIAALAMSIESNGLMHPIVVDSDDRLVAGGRRLEAVKRLGWPRIPARRFESLTPDELRDLELAENVQRLDLDSYEASKERMREIEAAVVELRSEPERNSEPKPGRPTQSDSTRSVAKKTGMSPTQVHETRKHVEAGERYPVLQGAEWKRGAALDAASHLDSLDDDVADAVADIIAEPGVPTKVAIKIIENVASKPKAEQRTIAKLYRSEDPSKQALAKTRAANVPPAPPHRLTWLRDALRLIDKALDDKIRVGREDLRSAHSSLKSALKQSEDHYQEVKKAEGF